MGMLRVLLALAVLITHTGGIGGYIMTGGMVAVQAFYVISGFYMGLVLNERYDRPALNGVFYLNRAIRIYSTYFFFLALYLALFAAVQVQTGDSPLERYFTEVLSLPEKLFLGLLNLSIVGQDVTLHLVARDGHLAWSGAALEQGGREVYRFLMIPVAWSMALEIYFYALAPFIVRRPVWQIAALAALSLGARIAGGLLGYGEDPFAYRFFPFELAVFLAGVLGYKAWAAAPALWERLPARLLALAVPATLLAYPWLPRDAAHVGAILVVACGLPAVHAWSRNLRFDRQLGELSYPLYLGHFLVVSFIPVTPFFAANPALYPVVVASGAVALAWLVARCFDPGVEALRRRLAARYGAAESAVGAKKTGDKQPRFA